MDRRKFLKLLGLGGSVAVALAAAGVDPELLTWKPGKAFSLPPKQVFDWAFRKGDIITMVDHGNPVLAIHPLTRQALKGVLQHFIITADVLASDTEVPLSPVAPSLITPAQCQSIPWIPPTVRAKR